jgi:polysaccharide export outer membrane protein
MAGEKLRLQRLVAGLSAAAFLAGIPPTSVAQTSGGPAAPTAAAGPAETPTTDRGDYVLGPGDKLRITVFNEPSLTGEFAISSGGVLAFPLVGDVPASGATLSSFTERLRQKLADGYLRDPKVSMEVVNYRPFYILGEVNKPGEYPYSSGLTIVNAIATAGGFTYRANHKHAMVRHEGAVKEEPTEIAPTTPVAPGDTIRIRERFF